MPFRRNRVNVNPGKYEKASLNGLRKCVVNVRKDVYRGEWKSNRRHGRGTFVWNKSGDVYEGDWEEDKRCGFGVLSVRVGEEYFKRYVGNWKNNMYHGYGTLCYFDNEFYEGEFKNNLRNGWGKMHWSNGDVYEGDWYQDLRHGRGVLEYANSQRVECHWFNDKKFGPGKHYFPLTGQLLRGYWENDVCKAGTMEDYRREEALNQTLLPIPKCYVMDMNKIVQSEKYPTAPISK